jgi:hypothetical protein
MITFKTWTLMVLMALLCGSQSRAAMAVKPAIETQATLTQTIDEPFLAEIYAVVSDGSNAWRVPAFWNGGKTWGVRFTPPKTGRYQVALERLHKGREIDLTPALEETLFMVSEAPDNAFIELHPEYVQRFRVRGGDNYYPVGNNICFTRRFKGFYKKNIQISDYEENFSAMRQAGFNYTRLFFLDDNRSLFDGPLGEHQDAQSSERKHPEWGAINLDAARFWDQTFELAAQYGIRVMLCLESDWASQCIRTILHGDKAAQGAKAWERSPWHVKNGGHFESPLEKYTNPEFQRLHNAFCRYVIGRWGWSTALMAVELENEMYCYTVSREKPDLHLAWMERQLAYLREIDPYDHLFVTGTGRKGYVAETSDFYQPHAYPNVKWDDLISRFGDPALHHGVVSTFDHPGQKFSGSGRDPWTLDKPVFWGEFGINQYIKQKYAGDRYVSPPAFAEKIQIERRMLWESAFAGGAGAGMLWDTAGWELHCDAYTLWKPMTEFLALAHFPETPYRPVEASAGNACVALALADGVHKDKSVVYLYDPKALSLNKADHKPIHTHLVLKDLSAGTYKVGYFDTFDGKLFKAETRQLFPGGKMALPPFRRDLAVYFEQVK